MPFTPGFDRSIAIKPDDWVIGVVGAKVVARAFSECSPEGGSSLSAPPNSVSSNSESANPFLFQYHEFLGLDIVCDSIHFLGHLRGRPCFFVHFLTAPDDALISELGHSVNTKRISANRINAKGGSLNAEGTNLIPPKVELANLRSFLGVVDDGVFSVAARALQLSHWLKSHRYCGQCGSLTQPSEQERTLVCTQCDAQFYPRISPCVIGLIWKGDTFLLAHNASFREGLYSVLAGFIEPGESAEQALAREVKEEVNIEIHPPVYVSSQPWPFPSQLMLGFFAEYKSGELCVDGQEILHAKWCDVNNLPLTPPAETISGQLIERFIRSRTKGG